MLYVLYAAELEDTTISHHLNIHIVYKAINMLLIKNKRIRAF